MPEEDIENKNSRRGRLRLQIVVVEKLAIRRCNKANTLKQNLSGLQWTQERTQELTCDVKKKQGVGQLNPNDLVPMRQEKNLFTAY